MLALILSIPDPIKRDLVLDLYLNYQNKCLAIAFNILHNLHASEDVLHDVFEKLVENPYMLEYDTAKRNWPYVSIMIKHACINCIRNNKKIALVDDFDRNENGVPPLTHDLDLIDLVSTHEKFIKAVQAIMELPNIYKDAILLRYGNGLSDAEISEHLSISVQNVRVRIFRALNKLQDGMNEQDRGDQFDEEQS